MTEKDEKVWLAGGSKYAVKTAPDRQRPLGHVRSISSGSVACGAQVSAHVVEARFKNARLKRRREKRARPALANASHESEEQVCIGLCVRRKRARTLALLGRQCCVSLRRQRESRH